MIAYAITDPSTLNFNTLGNDIRRFSNKADMIVYRDKDSENYALNAKLFLEETKKHIFQKNLLHTDYILAYRLKADGVHLKSTQFDDIKKAKALGLFVVISTHSKEEAFNAQSLGVDMITYSPIFTTPNKGTPHGLTALEKLTSLLDIPVLALGGMIGQKQIDLCMKNGAFGFASIRYFS